MKAFRFFQGAKTLSSTGDEMWATMLPVYFASVRFGAKEVGFIFSSGALGSLLGFLVMPLLESKFKSAHVALLVDLLQLLVFIGIVISLLGNVGGGVEFWLVIQFLTTFSASLWFSASETMITRISDEGSAQNAHRWNYFSSSVGPAVGPLLGGLIYQTFGMILLALVNAVSFVAQAAALIGLSKHERFFDSSQHGVLRRMWSGARSIWLDRRLRYLTLMPLVIKVFLLGAMPFVAFRLSQAAVGSILTGAFFAVFAAGNLLGAVSYKTVRPGRIAKSYRNDSSCLLIAGVALNIFLFYSKDIYLASLISFVAGFFIARYSIELRSMRQMIVPKEQIATVISAQGFLARIATPLAGVIYGYLLIHSNTQAATTLLVVFAFVGTLGIWGTYMSFNNAKDLV